MKLSPIAKHELIVKMVEELYKEIENWIRYKSIIK